MSVRDSLEEEKERRDRHSRGGRAESPGFCPLTKIDQGLTEITETRSARGYYNQRLWWANVYYVPWDVAEKLALHRTRRLCPIQRRGLGSRGVGT
jgi:hypothetical protein